MADDGFTKFKFGWLDQVLADAAVSASAFKLAYIIAAKFLNRRSREAYPSQETLGKHLGISTAKGVRYLVDQLVSGGHLGVIAAHGRGQTNKYLLVLKTVAGPIAESSSDDDDVGDDTTGNPSIIPEGNNKAKTTSGGARGGPPEAVSAAVSRQGGTSGNADGARIENGFELWWRQYPRRVGKAGAQRLYDRLITKGQVTAEELLAGALRYSAAQTGKDPRYIKGGRPARVPDGAVAAEAEEPVARRSRCGIARLHQATAS
jgi:hypothetical protein